MASRLDVRDPILLNSFSGGSQEVSFPRPHANRRFSRGTLPAQIARGAE